MGEAKNFTDEPPPSDRGDAERKKRKLLDMMDDAQENINKTFEKNKRKVNENFDKLTPSQQDEMLEVGSSFSKLCSSIGKLLDGIVNSIIDFFQNALEVIRRTWYCLRSSVSSAWQKITSAIGNIFG